MKYINGKHVITENTVSNPLKNKLPMYTEYTNGKKKKGRGGDEILLHLLNVYYSDLKNKTYQ